MGERDAGLTLEALAQRLEALERENERMRLDSERMRSENAELRSKVDSPEGSGMRRDGLAETRSLVPRRERQWAAEFEGRVSRRALLGKAGAAAVAAMAAGTLLYPREARANHYDDFIKVNYVDTHRVNAEALYADSAAVVALNTANDEDGAVLAENSGDGPAVRARGGTGVWGSSLKTGYSGVYGEHRGTAGYGVVGDGKGFSGAGVVGRNSGGEGVRGVGSTTAEVAGVRGLGKTGVWGSSSVTGYSGVYGQHTGTAGTGVAGDGKGTGAGVLGRNPGGTGVRGEGKTGVLGSSATQTGVIGQHTGSSGTGVQGVGRGASSAGVHGVNYEGYGGAFFGGKAPLKLSPGGSAGRPTTGAHSQGEIYLDSAATMFVCVADGTPGTWRRVQTVAT